MRARSMFSLTVLLFLSPVTLAWDNDEMDLFDLVEEVNKNFYEVMGLDQAYATTKDVRSAYNKLTFVLHPDKNDAPDAEVKFRQLDAIYEVLKDKTKREMYDKVLVEGLPNWRNPAFYFRRMRKIGLAKGLLYLLAIATGTFTVKKVWKQFDDEDNDSHSSVVEVISTVQDSVSGLKDKIESLEESVKTVTNLEETVESLKQTIKTLQVSLGGAPKQPAYPDCPICLENMTHEMKIMQCGLGHLICQKCFDRLDYSICPTCDKAITGRCHGMENYLKTLFDNNYE